MKGKKREKLIISVIGLFLILAVMPSTSLAVPGTINYQGYLTNAGGEPLNTTKNITFTIYPSGGSNWIETQSVDIVNGIFSVILGDVPANPIDPAIFQYDCELGVQVEGDAEMSPRQKLTSVAYSIRAEVAESALSAESTEYVTAGGNTTYVGVGAGNSTSTGQDNTFIGSDAGHLNTSGYSNTFLGTDAGYKNLTGSWNVFIGREAGLNNDTGGLNTFIGFRAGQFSTDGVCNTFLGHLAGNKNNPGLGYGYNTFIGCDSGRKNVSGYINTFIGAGSGENNVSGYGNVFLGRRAGYDELGSNKLYIDNSNTSAPLIWGDFENDKLGINGNIGIGHNNPGDTRLSVAGNVHIDGTTTFGLLTAWNHGTGGAGVFTAEGPEGAAVLGQATSTESEKHYGGDFRANGPNGIGVSGSADGLNGQGVLGFTGNINGRGVAGLSMDTTGTGNSYGGWFRAESLNGIAVYGLNYDHGGSPDIITQGYLGGGDYGAYGEYGTASPAYGLKPYGFLGGLAKEVTGGADKWVGVFGYGAPGVLGKHMNSGNYGKLGMNGYGVYGKNITTGNNGYFGSSEYGAYGEHGSTGNYGYLGSVDYGVYSGGDSYVEGNLTAEGIIESTTGGFKFPDGTTQTTSAGTGGISGVQMVTQTHSPYNLTHCDNFPGPAVTAQCPPDHQVLGGGGSGNGILVSSYPANNGTAWATTFGGFVSPGIDPLDCTTYNANVTVYAICAPSP